ncbi:MAG: acetyl-CoA decarbonylase/synthase complex subunit gamma, partial [Candidatus Omnitrophica bacterium]|nr:acetyl-CoA decarbonylase/synthase complex subunit gamma [Candidatus Omnitrophota bacterium]
VFVAKYGSVILLSKIKGEVLFPLLIERLNVYTDPQRPMTTTEGIYEIGKPDENSPVFVTTNFSLTYFIVSGEIENSKVPSYLLIQDTEGLSVLTAWAADKFNAETIANLVKKTKIGEKVNKKVLIIPGVVAQIYGELEEALPEWKIVLGPREAAHIPSFLKNVEI